MRPVRPPESGGPLHRSVAACLASILELGVAEVPVPEEGHPEPWTVWRTWLAQRGLGLVPISEPGIFDWPGPWLALLQAHEEEGCIGAVAFGAPPGVAWNPLGGPESFDSVQSGYVIAAADVGLWAPERTATPPGAGTVEAVMIAPEREGPMTRVDRAVARAGRGTRGRPVLRTPRDILQRVWPGPRPDADRGRGTRRPGATGREARPGGSPEEHPQSRHRPQRFGGRALQDRRGRVLRPAVVPALRAPGTPDRASRKDGHATGPHPQGRPSRGRPHRRGDRHRRPDSAGMRRRPAYALHLFEVARASTRAYV